MANRVRRLWGIIALASAVMLLGGCGSATPYPGLYGPNYGYAGVPTQGRYNTDENGPVVLGGKDAAFIAELGHPVNFFGSPMDPNLPNGLMAFAHYPNTFIDGVVAVRDIADSGHEHQIMVMLLSAPPDQDWTQDAATEYSMAYAPADAVETGAAPVANTRGLSGVDTVYSSATLAKTFPASAFTDDDGNPVTPGAFNIQCIYPSASQSNQILSCQLGLGTRQTFHV